MACRRVGVGGPGIGARVGMFLQGVKDVGKGGRVEGVVGEDGYRSDTPFFGYLMVKAFLVKVGRWIRVSLLSGLQVLVSNKRAGWQEKGTKARLVVKGFQQISGIFRCRVIQSVSWERRKPSVQVEEKSVRIKASTETIVLEILTVLCKRIRCSKKQVLGYVLTVGNNSGEEFKLTEENEEPCRDVHQVGGEREVEVLRNFNWPLSELITEDGVLPESGYSQFNDVRKDTPVALFKGRMHITVRGGLAKYIHAQFLLPVYKKGRVHLDAGVSCAAKKMTYANALELGCIRGEQGELVNSMHKSLFMCDDLTVKLNQTKFTAATYKRGLATVEEQLITYRKNEVLFSKEVTVLKGEVACKDYEINVLKSEFEKVKEEKDGIEFKIENFDKASKDLDQLLGSQITDKSKKGLGYNAVPPPHPLIYNRPKKLDQSYFGLDEFKEPRFKGYGPENSEQESNVGKPQQDDKGFVDSGCSRHMTGNIAYLLDFKEFDGGYVAFGGGAYGGRITGKGTLKTNNLDFEDVYFVNELKFNLFSVSQMCDKKNYVLFTDTECLVLSPNFKLPDENQILLKIPRKDNMYSFDMKNIVPKESLTCLVAKATLDESMLWHRRLGHINFKNINKLVKDNLVRGLPTKHFENDQTCVACLKGKQHRASCKSKVLNPITKPLFMLHMDLFGPTFVSSLMHKKYCLVVTDDYSRFTWVFFLITKDETSEILKNFIKEIENLTDKIVKLIKSDNGTEFKNKVMDDFCREKGIKREYSVARTPQQNGVVERRNRTLIEAARTMLADSKLPTTFWAEAVSTTCYVQNKVLVVKPHNKTPYDLFRGFKPALSVMRLFGCHVIILNTLDSLGKFDGKSDEGTSEENSQDCIVMSIWKDTSYFDSPTKDVDNDDSSTKDVNAAGRQVNTASPDVNTGSLKLNVVGPSVSTASPNEEDSTEEEPEVDLGNITNSYIVPTTPNTRIHKNPN
ncbi:putative ribonuclease H-like domain-containing protein [Tanacetum coccineum]|uniref:Ribonuclease H-like domain-containing protein n=1 Tax=Tanacetum coccineum TaxID=301880 RepID=A0ABQ5IAN3_9ASTR